MEIVSGFDVVLQNGGLIEEVGVLVGELESCGVLQLRSAPDEV